LAYFQEDAPNLPEKSSSSYNEIDDVAGKGSFLIPKVADPDSDPHQVER
jgi:hypothetical protein